MTAFVARHVPGWLDVRLAELFVKVAEHELGKREKERTMNAHEYYRLYVAASDQLFMLAAGEHVILRRPGCPEARVVVSEPWHLDADGNGQVGISYELKGGPEFPVSAYDLAFNGWVIRSDEGSRVCVFEVI